MELYKQPATYLKTTNYITLFTLHFLCELDDFDLKSSFVLAMGYTVLFLFLSYRIFIGPSMT